MAACVDVYTAPPTLSSIPVHMKEDYSPGNGNGIPIGNKTSGNDEDRKLFLGGLSWDTTEADIWTYFSKFGTVVDVSIKYDPVTGNPRGFGFITLAEHDAVDQVLTSVPHQIKNKIIDPKRAKSRPICKKIFVGGVDANISEDEIKDYFSQYGTVEGIELPFDRQRGRRREFCFIIFYTEEGADAACQEPKQTIGGRECDIKKAQRQPMGHQRRMQQQQQQQQSGTNPLRYMNQYSGAPSPATAYGEDSSGMFGPQNGGTNGDSYQRKPRPSNPRGPMSQNSWGYGGDSIVLPRTYRNSSYQGAPFY